MARFAFKYFLWLLSIAGLFLTLHVVYTIYYAREKPQWVGHFVKKAELEIKNTELKRKSYIQKVQACMDAGGKCDTTTSECDKNVYNLFFRCVGLKKDDRKVISIESDFH